MSIELAVSDLKLSKRFYSELFGWTATQDGPAQVIFTENGERRLVLRTRTPAEQEKSIFDQERVELLILADDMDATKDRLRKQRILFKEMHERKLEVIDPDQHLITVRDRRDAHLGTDPSGTHPRIIPGGMH
jgi:catechol 2,3-dioxygenase-like lactoylglutathione lyase family enzyme